MDISKIKAALDDKQHKWALGAGYWMNCTEELVDEVERIQADLRKLVKRFRKWTDLADYDSWKDAVLDCADEIEKLLDGGE